MKNKIKYLIKLFKNDSNIDHCLGESGTYDCCELDLFMDWLNKELCKHTIKGNELRGNRCGKCWKELKKFYLMKNQIV